MNRNKEYKEDVSLVFANDTSSYFLLYEQRAR